MKQIGQVPEKVSIKSRATLFGFLFALCAPLSWAIANVISKSTVTEAGTPPLVASAFSMSFGLITIAVIAARGLVKDIGAPRSAFLMAAFTGLFASSANFSLFVAFSKAPLTAVVPIIGTQAIFTIFLSQVLIRKLERITWRLLMGAALVVSGVVMIALSL